MRLHHVLLFVRFVRAQAPPQEGRYAWGRAHRITVVIPWYRPCQMERTSRWEAPGRMHRVGGAV